MIAVAELSLHAGFQTRSRIITRKSGRRPQRRGLHAIKPNHAQLCYLALSKADFFFFFFA